jgi:hypothetical protein
VLREETDHDGSLQTVEWVRAGGVGAAAAAADGGAADVWSQPCASNPCHNSGTCSDDTPAVFSCACTSGWNGTLCEVDINECDTDNGGCAGQCANIAGGFECGPVILSASLAAEDPFAIQSMDPFVVNDTAGGQPFVFRVDAASVDVHALTLSYGPASVPRLYTCQGGGSLVEPIGVDPTNQTVRCNLSAGGVGAELFFAVSGTGPVSGAVLVGDSTASHQLFAFPSPTITNTTLRLNESAPGTEALNMPNTLSTQIYFEGTGFAPDESRVSVTFGTPAELGGDPLEFECTLTTALTTATRIVCITENFAVGANLVLTVNAGGQIVTGTGTPH